MPNYYTNHSVSLFITNKGTFRKFIINYFKKFETRMAAAIPHSKTTQFKLKINIKNSRSSEFFDPSPSKVDHLHSNIFK